jgi:hypothetical protein
VNCKWASTGLNTNQPRVPMACTSLVEQLLCWLVAWFGQCQSKVQTDLWSARVWHGNWTCGLRFDSILILVGDKKAVHSQVSYTIKVTSPDKSVSWTWTKVILWYWYSTPQNDTPEGWFYVDRHPTHTTGALSQGSPPHSSSQKSKKISKTFRDRRVLLG